MKTSSACQGIRILYLFNMIKIYYNISTKIQKKSESIAKSQIVPSPLMPGEGEPDVAIDQ